MIRASGQLFTSKLLNCDLSTCLRMSNYKDFQIILLMRKNGVPKVQPKRRTPRSSNGCLTCKRKKIKCDETKWICKRCLSSRLDCRWPDKVLDLHLDLDLHDIEGLRLYDPPYSATYTWPEIPEVDDITGTTVSDSSSVLTLTERSLPSYGSPYMNGASEIDQMSPSLELGPRVSFQEVLDLEFLGQFSYRFLPAIAQMHFHDASSRLNLMLSGAGSSDLLRGIFVACGAALVAYDDNSYKSVAIERYNMAMNSYFNELNRTDSAGGEDWLLVAVQVLQTLCYRDSFGSSNATRAATHFGAAYQFISLRIFGISNKNGGLDEMKVLRLDLMMIENFIFNYSLTIMFCDHEKLPHLVMSPYVLFSQANSRLKVMYASHKYPHLSQMAILAFQVAAKSAWLCRLSLPLTQLDHFMLTELLMVSEVALLSMNLLNSTTTSIAIQKTVSVARVVFQAARILVARMLDPKFDPELIQDYLNYIRGDVSQLYNTDTIFPVWAIFIAGSASVDVQDREFFRAQIKQLMDISRSLIVRLVADHLEKMWMLYSGLEPLDLLMDTRVLDSVCK